MLLLLLSRHKVIQQAVVARGSKRGHGVSSNDAVDAAADKGERACLAQLAHAVFKDKLVLAGVKLRCVFFLDFDRRVAVRMCCCGCCS